MENASKALLMAAGVLIGVLILSLAVYLFVSFGTTSAKVYDQIEEQRLNKFNTQFTSYAGQENLTIYDIITVANLATDNNIYYGFSKRPIITDYRENDGPTDFYILVHLEQKGYIEGNNSVDYSSKYNEYIAEYGIDKKFNCTVKISKKTKRVYEVSFKEPEK